MQVFNAFFKIAFKRLPSISIYFIIFAVLTFLLSGTSDESTKTAFQSTQLKLCIIDNDHSDSSKALTEHLDSMHKLVKLENKKEVLQDSLYYRTVDYILTIPEGYEENLISGNQENLLTNTKVPGSNSGTFVDNQISQYLKTLNMYIAGGYTLDDALTQSAATLNNSVEVNSISFGAKSDKSSTVLYGFFSYLPYIFIVLLLGGLCPILVTLSRKEIGDRTACSSLSLTKKNVQVTLGAVVYSLATWFAFMLLAYIAYGSVLFSTLGLRLMLNSFVFLLVASSITLFVSFFAPNENIVNMISNVLGLGMSFIGGVFVPQWMLGDNVLRFARFLPTFWYVKANNLACGISGLTYNGKDFYTFVGVELIFAIAIFSLGLVISKSRRRAKQA